ncbi:MAG: gliding motility-associated C-terminal domain-containing protein [Flavobacteriales bacterium]
MRVLDFVCGPPNIYVPNAFTPNGDGENDRLFVRANLVTDIHFAIYDRWGELVFETTKLDVGWNGEFKGEALDPDVYVYYLKATCAGGQSYYTQGNVTLIR